MSKAGPESSFGRRLQHPVATHAAPFVIVIHIAKPQAENKAPLQSFGSQPASTMHYACNSTGFLLRTAMTTTLGAADVCCCCFSPLTPRPKDPSIDASEARVSPVHIISTGLSNMLQLHQLYGSELTPEKSVRFMSHVDRACEPSDPCVCRSCLLYFNITSHARECSSVLYGSEPRTMGRMRASNLHPRSPGVCCEFNIAIHSAYTWRCLQSSTDQWPTGVFWK